MPPEPPVTYPPSAPTGVTAAPADGFAAVSWSVPQSSGPFPITDYEVLASPGAKSCLTKASTVTCEVSGLTNGTAYTFSVRALNGAGWGAWSSASEPVTPSAPTVQSITLRHGERTPACRTNCRGDQHDRITTKGSSVGLAAGTRLTAWVRYGKGAFTPMKSTITVDAQGMFTWIAKRIPKGKKVTAYVAFESVQSNRQVWAKIR